MLHNYLKVARRTLSKQKGYTFINVVGLAVGLAVCFVIALFVRHELSYDQFHPDADQIYRVVSHERTLPNSYLLAPALREEFPQITHAVRISDRYGEVLIKHGSESRYESRFFFTDPSFFDVFGFKLIAGDPNTLLDAPFKLVLTESMAAKYFGDQNPIGKSLNIKGLWDAHDYYITGVVQDPPSNSHFKFNFLTSQATRWQVQPNPQKSLDSWYHIGDYTYVKLQSSENVASLKAEMPAFYLRHQGERFTDREIPDLTNVYTFQPVKSIHFDSHLEREFEANSDIRYVYVFVTVAILILLIACINFVNLATARAALRARETGLRKVAGASRKQLVFQHLMESGLLTGTALLLAVPLVFLILPLVNDLAGANVIAIGDDAGPIVFSVLGIGVVVSLLAGLYPAFYITRVEPTQILKGLLSKQASNTWFHYGLVVVQFVVSAVLILGTLVIQSQLDFLQNKRLGLNPEQVVVINTRNALGRQFGAYRNALLSATGIESVTVAMHSMPARNEEMIQHALTRPKPGTIPKTLLRY